MKTIFTLLFSLAFSLLAYSQDWTGRYEYIKGNSYYKMSIAKNETCYNIDVLITGNINSESWYCLGKQKGDGSIDVFFIYDRLTGSPKIKLGTLLYNISSANGIVYTKYYYPSASKSLRTFNAVSKFSR